MEFPNGREIPRDRDLRAVDLNYVQRILLAAPAL
jgi:hypothetical protein